MNLLFLCFSCLSLLYYHLTPTTTAPVCQIDSLSDDNLSSSSNYSSSSSSSPTCSAGCDYCESTCMEVPHDRNHIHHCLGVCGFAIIPYAYDVSTLEAINTRIFSNWTRVRRRQYKGRNHLRGKRREYVLPHNPLLDINGFNSIIYNPIISETSLTFMRWEMEYYAQYYNDNDAKELLEEPVILDTITIIEAPGNEHGGDIAQGFHEDGPFGVKIQIPLINITYNNGPVEIVPRLGGICPTVFGIVNIGTAIMYLQNVPHRGSKNSNNENRPVIDMSFLYLSHHYDDNYIRDIFADDMVNIMNQHQDLFEIYCSQSDECKDIPMRKTYEQYEIY